MQYDMFGAATLQYDMCSMICISVPVPSWSQVMQFFVERVNFFACFQRTTMVFGHSRACQGRRQMQGVLPKKALALRHDAVYVWRSPSDTMLCSVAHSVAAPHLLGQSTF